MNDSENICLSCGLCCDGTLIGYVQLERDEVPALKELMGIEEVNGHGFFLHPCHSYCDGCTIYNHRPKQCVKFKCGLLNSVEQKELAFHKATDLIDIVKQKKETIEEKLIVSTIVLQSKSFYFKMVELKKILQDTNPGLILSQNQLDLRTELIQLDKLLTENFNVSLD